jgi:hypothetical protein
MRRKPGTKRFSMCLRGSTLKLLGLLILLAGVGSAVVIWETQDRIDRQDIEGTTALAPEDSRRYTHDVEQYYGKSGLLADKWTRWFEGLAHGKGLAKTIAVVSMVAASGCFLSGRLSKAKP